ncbi:unnamed protein product [Protopolystoma xenopodis]|uniref:Uncharacterized protein n=1 Tax=Protopolystoma xenopodis TaxID=117903 RepID=A0A3S5AHV9_9PLAT|nr:unnamed protein product [Protopolystoma xenopodis]
MMEPPMNNTCLLKSSNFSYIPRSYDKFCSSASLKHLNVCSSRCSSTDVCGALHDSSSIDSADLYISNCGDCARFENLSISSNDTDCKTFDSGVSVTTHDSGNKDISLTNKHHVKEKNKEHFITKDSRGKSNVFAHKVCPSFDSSGRLEMHTSIPPELPPPPTSPPPPPPYSAKHNIVSGLTSSNHLSLCNNKSIINGSTTSGCQSEGSSDQKSQRMLANDKLDITANTTFSTCNKNSEPETSLLYLPLESTNNTNHNSLTDSTTKTVSSQTTGSSTQRKASFPNPTSSLSSSTTGSSGASHSAASHSHGLVTRQHGYISLEHNLGIIHV